MSTLSKQGLILTAIVIGLSALNGAQAALSRHDAGARIAQGRNTGELTDGDAAWLNSERRALHPETLAYRADGHIDAAERKDLREDSARLDRDIYNQKHDAQTATHLVQLAYRDPLVNRRQLDQHGRIVQGVRSGELTRTEARGLRAEQRGIRQEERRDRSDGVLTKEERRDLHQNQNAASKDIYQQKHDADTR